LQFVSSPNLLSDWEIVRHGVLKESVLSALLLNRGNRNGFEGSCMGKGISLRTFAEI